MFRTIILPIFRSTRLCVTVCGKCTHDVAGRWPATSWVHYTTSCNTQSSAPEDVQNNCPKHAELSGIIKKPLLLHLVGCLHYSYFIIFFLRLANRFKFIPLENVVYFITLHVLVRKIFTFYLNDVLLFKCPFPGPKWLIP